MNWNRCLRVLLWEAIGFVAAGPLCGQLPGQTISISCSGQAAAGAGAHCSVGLTLGSGVTVDNLTFGAAVKPTGNAPALTSGSLSFSDSVGGGFASTGGTTDSIAVVWASLSPALSGSPTLGSVSFVVPAGAATGQTYSVEITGASASLGNTLVNLSIGSASSVSVPQPAPLSITGPSTLPNGVVGSSYPGATFTASGGTGSYTWSATGLPLGLSMSTGGQLSGTPTQHGSYTPEFTVRDSSSNTVSESLPLVIGAASSSCSYALTPGSKGFAQSGGNGSVSVSVASGCLWTAMVSGGENWISLTGVASGMGNGTVSYQVLPNHGSSRTGTLTIGGATFTVVQTGVTTAPAGSLPHFTAGAGWDTTITIVNLWPVAEQIHLNLFEDDGDPASLPVIFPLNSPTAIQTISTVDQTLGPGAELIIRTVNASSATPISGWIQLITDGKAAASCVFAWTEGGDAQEAVVLSEDRNASAYLLPFDNTDGMRTGLAAANVSSQNVTIAVILRNGAGTQLGTATINMAAHGHTQFMLDEAYPVTQGQIGTAEFDVPPGSQISLLGIRATPKGAITSVPVLAK